MKRRVAERRGDASDATVETVDLQLEQGSGPVRWTAVSTQGGLADVVDTVRAVLAAPGR
jgi:predicted kinase